MVETEQVELEEVLGHRFQRSEWLERALTHSSLRNEGDSGSTGGAPARGGHLDNQRLEFLGDAILSALVSEHLVTSFPEWSEGQLSKGRAKIVRASSLHAAARRLGLGRYLRLGRGEEKSGGREKPAALADAYEAIVAAIYLDAGLEAARGFVQRTLLGGEAGWEAQRLGEPDHKSGLQEFLQGSGLAPAAYRVVRESGPDHRKTFVVEVSVAGRAVASGSGASKKEAEQAAARQALAELRRGGEQQEGRHGGSHSRR